MKPFDLEAAKRGEPICLGDGTPAKFLAHVPELQESSRVLVLAKSHLFTRYISGRLEHSVPHSASDLYMAPKKRTVWVNVYVAGEATTYNTQTEADEWFKHSKRKYRAGNKAWPLEIEE